MTFSSGSAKVRPFSPLDYARKPMPNDLPRKQLRIMPSESSEETSKLRWGIEPVDIATTWLHFPNPHLQLDSTQLQCNTRYDAPVERNSCHIEYVGFSVNVESVNTFVHCLLYVSMPCLTCRYYFVQCLSS